MFCPNCGSQIPDNAQFCASCGTRVSDNEPGYYSDDTFIGRRTYSEYYEDPDYNEAPPVKKRIRFSSVLKVVIPIFLVIICLFIFKDYIMNGVMSLTSPEKHQAYVYKRAARKIGDMLLDNVMKDGESNEGTATLSMGDDYLDYMEENNGLDYSEYNELSLDYKYAVKDDNQQFDFTVRHPDIELNGEIRTNADDEEVTVLLPELNDEALISDIDDANIPVLPILSAIPEKKLARRVLGEYVDTLFMEFSDVNRGKNSYTINGNRKDSICFEMEFTEEELVDALLVVFEKAKDDEELEAYFDNNFFAVFDEDIDYDDMIDGAIESLEDYNANDDNSFVLYTYINSKGDVTALEIEADLDGDEYFIVLGGIRRGRSLMLEFSVTDTSSEDKEEAAIYAEGTIVGSKINLSAECYDNEEEVLAIELTDFSIKGKGGHVRISGEAFDSPEDLGDVVVEMDFSVKRKKYEYELKVSSDGDDMYSLSGSGEYKRAKQIELHTDTNDDADEWNDDFDEDFLEELRDIFTTRRVSRSEDVYTYESVPVPIPY